MASGRFETKCVGPLETVSLACNSGTVATVTLTATAISTDQNACLSISMSDVPTCPEFTSCLGSIGTGQLGTLSCLISPARSNANAYAGYRKLAFDKVCGGTSCSCGTYVKHYSAANTVYQSCQHPLGTFCNGRNCPFNIPPAIESLCYCCMYSCGCCSYQKGFNAMLIPAQSHCSSSSAGNSWWHVKKCCFQRFGGTLTDDCYYQLSSENICCACAVNCSFAVCTPTAFGGYGRFCINECFDVAVDWWSNGKFLWQIDGYGCGAAVCAPAVTWMNYLTSHSCSPWVPGDNQDSSCNHCYTTCMCCLNNYPQGWWCSYFPGGSSKGCVIKSSWGLPCEGLLGFYPMVMAGCNLQIYQHAYASAVAVFKSVQNNIWGACSTPHCNCGYVTPTPALFDSQQCIGLYIAPCACASTNPDKPHNFVRWVTYNHVDQQNYFMWYHQCTPVMNGIYSMSETQLNCIYQHQYNYCQCSAGSCQTTDAVINTKFATKVSCVPAIWCNAYTKAWCMLNTNVFASGCAEWSMFASPTDWGTSALCFCRFVSKDLVNWSQADVSGCAYKSELSNTPTVSCYIDFNPSTCNFEFNCSNYSGIPSANAAVLEHFTTTGKLERSGIVMGATDRFYVRNTSNSISASVTVWGFNE